MNSRMNDDTLSTSTRMSEGPRAPQMRAPASLSRPPQGQVQSLQLSDSNLDKIRAHEKLMRAHEMQRKAKNLPIPTTDKEVKVRLREMGQPICLFGEDSGDRRERLRQIVMKYYVDNGKAPVFYAKVKPDEEEKVVGSQSEQEDVFYTEGDQELREARLKIAKYSITQANLRLESSRRKKQEDLEEGVDVNTILPYFVRETQYADDRCASRGVLAPNEELFATSGWSGKCKVWGVPDCEIRTELVGHKDRVVSIRFHPQSTVNLSPDGPNLGTGSADGTVRLWSLNEDYEQQKSLCLKGHQDIVNYVEFHPMGEHIASASNDKTWRLWDLETQQELLLQEGHYGEVYPLSFQADGSLLASGDFQGIGLLWDLRSGKQVLSFQGHVKRITALSFHPNGYQLATGSDDNSVRIWDLRRKGAVATIPAHNKLVSEIKFDETGKVMVTCGYDQKCKMWAAGDWVLVRTLTGHENKVTSAAFARDFSLVLTTSFDRTFKLWRMKGKE